MNKQMKFLGVTLFLSFGISFFAAAAETPQPASSDKKPVSIGARTEQWLATQREGSAAGNLLPIPPAEAERSAQRYVDSFSQPIPDQFSQAAKAK